MRRFLVVSRAAAETITADRFLQSCEFDQGFRLASFLTNGTQDVDVGEDENADVDIDIPRVSLVTGGGGACFVRQSRDRSDAIVFDFDICPIFAHQTEVDALLVFQKTLRFAIRYWSRGKFTNSEHIVRGTTRGIVFPFPISTQSSYRILIECAPDAVRVSRRPQIGTVLLVYWAGRGDHSADSPTLTVFRKALGALNSAHSAVSVRTPTHTVDDGGSPIGLTRLGPLQSAIDSHVGFDNWESFLTSAQRKFVHAPIDGPHRIEGPAGSGKTICLVLRAIGNLRAAASADREHRCLFLAHSASTKRAIGNLFYANDRHGFATRDPRQNLQSILVTTLHDLCSDLLGKDIAESEFLDRDALESKNTQLLYVDEALGLVMGRDFATYKPLLSEEAATFFEKEDRWALSQMLQHEISVIIKGRANENLDTYRRVQRTRTGLPLRSDSDRGFVFLVFKEYQRQLSEASSFDTDDVVLSALGQLNTPIWRRRRVREGFDGIFVDETHLFNLNELSVMHHLTRSDAMFPISYATDPSQALEDRGWSEEGFDEAFGYTGKVERRATKIKSVFRCSPDIINLAFCATSSGATLFDNFDNPLRGTASAFTEADERLCARPQYIECVNDEELVRASYARAEAMEKALDCGRSRIAMIVFDGVLLNEMKRHASNVKKAVELIVERGDMEAVRRAAQSGRFVLCAPDYVGGLEFSGVVLVGIDQGRVPPEEMVANAGSAAFLSYQAHSRLYVAITRARYRVEVLGSAERGVSILLNSAMSGGAIERA